MIFVLKITIILLLVLNGIILFVYFKIFNLIFNLIFRYVSVLVELARVEGMKHGPLLAHQMLDVAVRVQAIRPFAVSQMTLLLNNAHMFMQPSGGSNMANVLYAAAWICGEYAK